MDVLDVGCVDHSAKTSTQQNWLHAHLAKHAQSCLGVDILEQDIEVLAAKGFHVKVWDVTAKPLHQQFDVIVCGELIEHVENPGGLFANCRMMLKPEGRLYVTTPNPWFVNYILKAAFSRKPIIENVDHVTWFEPCVMTEMAERNGLQLLNYSGIRVTQTNTWKASVFFRLYPLARALGLRKELFAKSIVYEFGLLRNPDDAPVNHERSTAAPGAVVAHSSDNV